MSRVIQLIVTAQGAPFHGGAPMNATRWSAICRNVVTTLANPTPPPHHKRQVSCALGGSPGGGQKGKKVYNGFRWSERSQGLER